MKVALFGGSFNPIQLGHCGIVKDLIERKLVDEVWLVPCKKHSFDKELVDFHHRVAMARIALKDLKSVNICKIELKIEGKSYTINTLRKLKSEYNHEFFIVIGSDILQEIEKWYKSDELFKETKFIVFKRKGYPIKPVKGMDVLFVVDRDEKNISSTEVRERLKQGKEVRDLISGEVLKYIKENHLFE